jgi:hypothetical protein
VIRMIGIEAMLVATIGLVLAAGVTVVSILCTRLALANIAPVVVVGVHGCRSAGLPCCAR